MSKSKKKNSRRPKGFIGNYRGKSIFDRISYFLLTLSGLVLMKGLIRADFDQLFIVATLSFLLLLSGLFLKNQS